MHDLKLSHEKLKENNNLRGSFPLLSLGLHMFNNGVLKDFILTHVSNVSHCSGHADTAVLNDSNYLKKSHVHIEIT